MTHGFSLSSAVALMRATAFQTDNMTTAESVAGHATRAAIVAHATIHPQGNAVAAYLSATADIAIAAFNAATGPREVLPAGEKRACADNANAADTMAAIATHATDVAAAVVSAVFGPRVPEGDVEKVVSTVAALAASIMHPVAYHAAVAAAIIEDNAVSTAAVVASVRLLFAGPDGGAVGPGDTVETSDGCAVVGKTTITIKTEQGEWYIGATEPDYSKGPFCPSRKRIPLREWRNVTWASLAQVVFLMAAGGQSPAALRAANALVKRKWAEVEWAFCAA